MFKNIFEVYSKAIATLFAPVGSLKYILEAALHSNLVAEGDTEIKIASLSTNELSSETINAIQDSMFQDGSKSWLKHIFRVQYRIADSSNNESLDHHIVIADDHVKLDQDKFSVSRYFFYNRKMPHEYDSQCFEFINAQKLIEIFRFRSLIFNTVSKLSADQILTSREIKSMFNHLDSNINNFSDVKKAILQKNDLAYSGITRDIYLCNNRFLKEWFNKHNIQRKPNDFRYKLFDAKQALLFGDYSKLTPTFDKFDSLYNNYIDYGNYVINVPLIHVIEAWLNDHYLTYLTKVIAFHAFDIKLSNDDISHLFIMENKKRKRRVRKANHTAVKSTDKYDLINHLELDTSTPTQKGSLSKSSQYKEFYSKQLSLF